MKCKHGMKHLEGYTQCRKDGSVRKNRNCFLNCDKFEPTLWSKLEFFFFTGKLWRKLGRK